MSPVNGLVISELPQRVSLRDAQVTFARLESEQQWPNGHTMKDSGHSEASTWFDVVSDAGWDDQPRAV